MEIRWSRLAALDLEQIFDYIAGDNPVAAGEVIQKLYDGCDSLKNFPLRGRISRIRGRRELLFLPLPYIAVYRVRQQVVEIIRIYHPAQNWP